MIICIFDTFIVTYENNLSRGAKNGSNVYKIKTFFIERYLSKILKFHYCSYIKYDISNSVLEVNKFMVEVLLLKSS